MSSPASSLSAPGTPSSRHGASSPLMLTPRSRVAALLATISDSSDDDDSDYVTSKPPPLPPTRKNATTLESHSAEDLSEDDDNDDELVFPSRPRGKLAGAMYNTAKPCVQGTAPKPSVESPNGALGKKNVKGDNDDEEMPLAPQRRHQRASNSIISPGSSPKPAADVSDDEDMPTNPFKNPRFMELVERKKKEREAREAEERKKEQERRARILQLEAEQGIKWTDEGEPDNDGDDQRTSRGPRRRAGKKALEEMHKETQRMARSMQLAHEAQTRKKVTKQSLFDKFNFKAEVVEPEQPAAPPEPPSFAEAAPNPAREESPELPDAFSFLRSPSTPKKIKATDADTPRPKVDKGKGKAVEQPLPKPDKGKGKAVEQFLPKSDKGKGKAIERPSPKPDKGQSLNHTKPLPRVKVHLPLRTLPVINLDADSDSDLEIIKPSDEKTRLLAEKKALLASLRRPRALPKQRQLSSPGKAHMTPKQLHLQLLEKSRVQAIKEREDKIEELKARGIIVQTAEEREKEMMEVESLLEKARKEALEIKRREQRAERLAKGEKHEEDEGDYEWLESEVDEDSEEEDESMSLLSSEDDEEQMAGEMIDAEADESGSEEEDMEMKDSGVSPASSILSVNRERDSVSPTPRLSSMPAVEDDDNDDDDDGGFAPFKRSLLRRDQRVTGDDDDMETDTIVPVTQTFKVPNIFKNMAQPSSLGMTQLFAGTMAGSVPFGTVGEDLGKKVDAMRRLPDEILPNSQAPPITDLQEHVPNSQFDRLDLSYSQSQIDNHNSLPVLTLEYSQSQIENLETQQPIPDPTQDCGFERASNPVPPRFEEPSNPTQVLDEQPLETKKPSRRRLRRRVADFSDEEKESSNEDGGEDPLSDNEQQDAFTVMKKATAAKKPVPKPFDKKKSEAKEMVQEQAEESDDEYAGGGGGGGDDDDDDDGADNDAVMTDLVDDAHQDVDERSLAAFYAQREKAQDEKDVNRLFRDLQNGLLRKKRGAGIDLDDDSDDEYLAQERRRRAKRRQMAQVRKALLQDEKLGKIATDPKKAAFFRVLEDNASDDDADFLDKTEEDLFANLNVLQSQDVQVPAEEQQQEAPIQQQQSRPVRAKKPGLAEIRETLSFLEESPLVDLSSDDEADTDSQTRRAATTAAMIDRTLSRTSSTISTSTKLAFQTNTETTTTTASGGVGFKVPTLLLRRTTSSNLTVSSGSDTPPAAPATTERSLGDSQAGKKMGGAKNCSINFNARAKVQRVEKGEERRRREREREARERVRGGLGALGRGGFS